MTKDFTDKEILNLCKRATDGCEFMPRGKHRAEDIGLISFSFTGRQARVIGRYLDDCMRKQEAEERTFRRWLKRKLKTDPEFREVFETGKTRAEREREAKKGGAR